MQTNLLSNLIDLVVKNPTNINYLNQLAHAYGQIKDWTNACKYFEKLYTLMPTNADICFNYAYHLRFCGEYKLAIKYYQKSITLNISQPEEVYVNVAVIYSDYLRQENNAENELLKALETNPDYVPALYNLANIYEDRGNTSKAILLFNEVIKKQPDYYDAIARLAQLNKYSSVNDPLYQQLLSANADPNIDYSTKININFALGKFLDDCGQYSKAFEYYHLANKLDKKLLPNYNRKDQHDYIERIKSVFTPEYFASMPKISDASPIFICGMFRSGSTLVEQILASHSKVTAGGEIEYFIRLVDQTLAPFPESLSTLEIEKYERISANYIEKLNTMFPNAMNVIDKRPENFLFIGLIKALFPKARFIYTQRHLLDNCLSVYFLRLGHKMPYASELTDIVHYYESQADLMSYWQDQFPDDIHCLDYDKLIKDHEAEIRHLLSFLELDWEESCLSFHKMDNTVKTASVWQVRQPIYQSSSGRWNNYKNELMRMLESKYI